MNAPARPRTAIRCAIYTRKSSEEGLDQDFNSLDAQYEACAAFIASQKHEGWSLSPERYDDGGVSGGTLERASLQRLLGDIDAGRIQMIVVYKIDRLTRSLADFARLIDRLDKAGCSFVSVTQAFNTSTSMGRLTLNVLLSFAQFEREVIAERIRDKLAASKQKGLWMGGLAPFGYKARDRALHIHEGEAAIVRDIFALYLHHANAACVQAELNARGVTTRKRVFASGRISGGHPFSRGALYHLLSNPVYAGRIRHKDKTWPGRHRAIIDDETWNNVQTLLGANTQGATPKRRSRASAHPSPLAGKITDETGSRLTPSHAVKSGRRYRYYVSSPLLTDRLPARELEDVLATAIARALQHPQAGARLLAEAGAGEIARIAPRMASLARAVDGDNRIDSLARLIGHVSIAPGNMAITLDRQALAQDLAINAELISPSALIINAAFTARRRGVETRLILDSPDARPDPTLINALAKAHAWWRALRSGQSMKAIADAENLSQRRIAHLMTLAFLAPDITEAILQGRQPPAMTTQSLIRGHIPLEWSQQRQRLMSR